MQVVARVESLLGTSVTDDAEPISPQRLRLAELTSALGAGVIGVGFGVLLAKRMAGLGLPVLLLGVLLHAWGMTDKHRLEAKAGAPKVWWSTLLYWTCWLLLAALIVYVAVGAAM